MRDAASRGAWLCQVRVACRPGGRTHAVLAPGKASRRPGGAFEKSSKSRGHRPAAKSGGALASPSNLWSAAGATPHPFLGTHLFSGKAARSSTPLAALFVHSQAGGRGRVVRLDQSELDSRHRNFRPMNTAERRLQPAVHRSFAGPARINSRGLARDPRPASTVQQRAGRTRPTGDRDPTGAGSG